MQIGSANACSIYFDQNIVDADFRLGHILQPKAGFTIFFD
jgi:hypothetical protein